MEKCAHCGGCRSVCPVFAVTRQEKYTARGKIALVKAALDNEISWTPPFYAGLSNCLMCLACVENCGSGVRTETLVTLARAAFVEKQGLSVTQRVLRHGLTSGDTAVALAGRMQKALFKKIPEQSGLRRRFPLPLVDGRQLVPELAAAPFRHKSDFYQRTSPGKKHVVYFTGCLANYAYTGIAASVVHVLTTLGVSVGVPPEQCCCGASMYFSGDMQAAVELARENLALLSRKPQQLIVTSCPSGGLMLRKHYPELFAGDPQWEGKARAVAEATMDIAEYLAREIGLAKIATRIITPFSRRTTYHDPCHLGRGQHVRTAPRDLLTLACGEHFVEMAEADRCCGLAGSYALSNRKTSLAIQDYKMRLVAAAEAEVVASGCPGCMMQLNDGLQRHHMRGRAMHTIEVLRRAMGLKF